MCPMLARAAIRLNPQSAMRKLQNRFRRSEPGTAPAQEWPQIGPPSSRGSILRHLFAHIPNLPTKAGLDGVRGRKIANSQAPNPQSANPQSAKSLAIGARAA
eukprot:3190222-Alexandrium_andersonii.AAC.1